MANNSHFLNDIKAWGEKTSALWAGKPGGTAIVFVHGFNGEATRSWINFPVMLPNEPKCQDCDLIFYGYDGVYTQPNFSAAYLYDFLNVLFTDPLSVINPTINPKLQRPADFHYDHILLVAHSLGSVVCRRALLNAYDNKNSWLDKTRMVLFAPAHMGARVQALALSALTGFRGWGAFLGNLATYKMPPLEELKQGSPTLTSLLNETTAALGLGATALKAHVVVWGSNDRIVYQYRFPGDPVEKPYPKKDHSEVCKPHNGFTRPVKDVIGALP